jgi:tyrosinase
MAGGMIYRLSTDPANAAFLDTYRQAVGRAQAIGDSRGYLWHAGIHGAPNYHCWHHQRRRNFPFRAQTFLPWHRAYLLAYEQALRDQVEDAAVPWWDWSATRRIPMAFAAQWIGTEPNPLFDFHIRLTQTFPQLNRRTWRSPKPDALPSRWWIGAVLADTDYMSFSDRVEDLHDYVHWWVGGDMGQVATAAFDPIFWSHHCMIDRLWYIWQVRHGVNNMPAELLDQPLEPFGMRVRDVLHVQALGYECAENVLPVPV